MAMQNSVLGKGSDFYEEITDACKPCSSRGKRLQSDCFCKDCMEHLCKECATYHTVLTVTQNHILITNEEAEKLKPMCKPCSSRGKRLQADRFCKECMEYLCMECATYHKVLTVTQNHILITNEGAKKETDTRRTVDPFMKAVKLSKSSPVTPSNSNHIQPGSRVCFRGHSMYGGGTVGRYDSSIRGWMVRWDTGYTNYHPTVVLENLKEQ